jgi:hypothetical protein
MTKDKALEIAVGESMFNTTFPLTKPIILRAMDLYYNDKVKSLVHALEIAKLSLIACSGIVSESKSIPNAVGIVSDALNNHKNGL